MNILNSSWPRKHPIVKTTGAILLATFIGLKIAHILPLMNLEEKYLEDFRANGYSLWPIATDFFRSNPKTLYITQMSDDTIIIQDIKNRTTFTLTCPWWWDNGWWSNEFCLVRDNPYVIRLTGTVFGRGESVSIKGISNFLKKSMNPDNLQKA